TAKQCLNLEFLVIKAPRELRNERERERPLRLRDGSGILFLTIGKKEIQRPPVPNGTFGTGGRE
ncbi:MAG: hypothetical protein ACI97X_002063, partial [Oceanospirillaceae bacterium]